MKQKGIKLTAALVCAAFVFALGAVMGERMDRTVSASLADTEQQSEEGGETGAGTMRDGGASAEQAAQTDGTPEEWLTQTQGSIAPEPPEQGIPRTAEEIIAYFNHAAEQVKTQAAAVTQTQDRLAILQASFGKSDLRAALHDLNRDDRTEQRIARELFPVRGEAWASRLTADGVESAQCTRQDGLDSITLTLRDETGNPDKAGIHGSCMTIPNAIDWESIDVTGFKCRDFTLSYNHATIECTVEAETGRLLTAHYYLHADARAEVTVGGMLRRDCLAEVESEARYAVDW